MVRVRKLVLAIAAASALTSGMAHALGLGEVSLKSALDQPLDAEIELLEARDLATGELLPSLASPDDFAKAGVDRQFFLSDLKFTPVIKPNGKSVIHVTSSKPVREPYLNFLVQVMWPNGRLLREYTLLLDPPLYSPQTTAAAVPQMPKAAPAPAPRPLAAPVRPAVASTAPAPAQTQAARPAASSSRKLEGKEYKTTSSDTLWEIARRVPGGTVQQTMLAIQDLNPDAFVGGNINRLKRGQVLRLPDPQQITSRSASDALAQVSEQTAAWREGRSLVASGNRQLDATKRNAAGAAPAQTESKDNLRLVAADAGKAAAGSDKGANGDSKALSDKLEVTKESLDSTRRENGELKSRMTDLQSQLDKLQRLIQLKDDQLAKLQADMAAKGKAAPVPAAPAAPGKEAAPVAAAPAVTPPPAPAAEPAKAAPVAVAPAAPAAPAPAADAAAKPAAPDFNYSEEAAKPAAPVQVPVEAAKPAVAAKPAKPVQVAPAAAPVAEPQSSSFIDDLLANPMLLGIAGGGGLLALLVGLMVVSRRNAMKEAELQNSLSAEDDSLDSDMQMPADSFDELDGVGAGEAEDQAEQERVTAQTADVLGEADIYIAYGKFTQAAELLQNAINQEPQRSDLRLKLLEVQAELGDRDAFVRQEAELREIGGANADIDLIKAKYPAMVVAAAGAATVEDELDAFSLDDLDLDEPLAPAAPGQDMDDAFDLSLDELDVSLDEELPPASAAQPAPVEDFAELSLDSDFDLDTPAAAPVAADDDLGFDLELDMATEAPEDALELTDDLADFSLELEADAQAGDAKEGEDFLLSLDGEPDVPALTDELSTLSLDESEELAAADLELPADFDLSLGDEAVVEPSADSFAAQLDQVSSELDDLSGSLESVDESSVPEVAPVAAASADSLDGDDDFDFLSGTDEAATKLDLARAYIDMGDTEGARDILDEVVAEGNDSQQQEARDLLARLS